MDTIKPFIDKGFYTVPLKGTLRRDVKGKKTIPVFEKNWNVRYSEEFNAKETDIGLIFTGSINDIIAIDCDNQATYDIFKSLNPNYKFEFVSKGKPEGGGTIIYKYDPDIGTFQIHDKVTQLDFYSDGGKAVYLPTKGNETKECWNGNIPKLQTMPPTVKAVLSLYSNSVSKPKEDKIPEPTGELKAYANYLAPQLKQFTSNNEFLPSLFRIITPKNFRNLEEYVKYGYLHPDSVPEGRGSEYLSKVSAILGSDVSVSKELYVDSIQCINKLWNSPIPRSKLEATIIKPMINGQSKIDGEKLWKYDSEWSKKGIMFSSKLGDCLELFFDDCRATYYLANVTKNEIRRFTRDSDMITFVETVGKGFPDKKKIKSLMPIVQTIINPSLEFGFLTRDKYKREFNLFNRTKYLNIINNPEIHKDNYKTPEVTIKFLETLIPDKETRNYVLGFLRKKFTSFRYSPVILYFIGVHGSGKDTFVTMLENILGTEYIARPTTKEFLEQFNGWMVDKYFVQLDEYGNQLVRLSDQRETLGKLKSYTGKDTVQIRQMRTDGYSYKHGITFIMTANHNPLVLEEGDRRVCLIDTPHVLKDMDWVGDFGGMTEVYNKIKDELEDFCYYLVTEVGNITLDEYNYPPYNKSKINLIADRLAPSKQIAFYLKNKMFKEFKDLCDLHDLGHILNHRGKLLDSDIMELYLEMTEGAGKTIAMTKSMRDANFTKIPTTRNGAKAYFYNIPKLEAFTAFKLTKYEGFNG